MPGDDFQRQGFLAARTNEGNSFLNARGIKVVPAGIDYSMNAYEQTAYPNLAVNAGQLIARIGWPLAKVGSHTGTTETHDVQAVSIRRPA
jgi:hypothetical protein